VNLVEKIQMIRDCRRDGLITAAAAFEALVEAVVPDLASARAARSQQAPPDDGWELYREWDGRWKKP